MPGNEVGDRVHNFFDQGNLSQDQRDTQFVAANWPGYNNNIRNANERLIGGPVNSGPDNYSSQQLDIEKGQGNPFPQGPNGLNFGRQNMRPEFIKNPSQLQQLNLNGFMHASQVGHTRHNEANFLGADTEAGRHNVTSRGPSVLDSQQRSGSQLTNFANFGGSESPMNFNIFGGQHRMNGQQPGMMQSLPQQQLGNNNAQLQQQYILKQMELQRQHQLQQFEAIQRNAATHMSPFPNQIAGQHPVAVNGNPSRDGSSMNWQQRGLSASMPGYSNGFMISPQQGQAMQFMGLIPQQASQSLYGLPVMSSQSPNAFAHRNMDKPGMLQVSAPSSSFSANQHSTFEEQSSSQHSGNMVTLGGFTQVQRNVPMSEGGEQGFAGGTELVTEKSVSQASSQGASTHAALPQAAVGLDPTEEKILFGNDVNIWEAFGEASLTGSGEATDLLSGFPSMQNGTWSALMQSAVAETSSNDGGMQEDWSGLGSQNSRQPSGSQHPSVSHSNEKSRVLVDSSPRASLGSHLSTNDVNIHNANTNFNYVQNLGQQQQQQLLDQRRDSSHTESQMAQEGRRWLDCHQQKPLVTDKRVVENSNSSIDFTKTDAGFWGHQQSSYLHNNAQQSSQPNPSNFLGSVPGNRCLTSINQNNLLDRDRGIQMRMDTGHGPVTRFEPVSNSNIQIGSSRVSSNVDAVAPGLSNLRVNLESSQKLPNNHHLDLWKSVNSSGKPECEVSGRDQHNLNKGPPILDSSGNSLDGGAAEMHETENDDRREGSRDGHHHSFPPNALVDNLRENMMSNSADQRSLSGGKEMSSSQADKRGPMNRKFQYHPMGDDVNIDSYETKQALHSQSLSQHFPAGVKGQEVNPRFLGPLSTNVTDMEGRVSNYHGPVNVSRGVSGAAHPAFLPNISAGFARSGEISSPNQNMPSRQNVLELLHKVDQSKGQNVVSHFSSADFGRLSDTQSGGIAGPSQSHLSTSHGFSLQLAPPSQVTGSSNLSDAVRNVPRTVGSPSTGHLDSEKANKHAWLVSESSAQCLPPSHQSTLMDSGTEPGKLGNMGGDVSEPNSKDNSSISSLKSPPQNEHLTAPGGKVISNQSATMAVDRQGFHDQHLNDSQTQAITGHPVSNSHGKLVAGGEMNQHGVQDLIRPMPASFPATMAGMSRKDNLSHLGNLWASQQHLLGAQACNVPELLKSRFQYSNALETSFTQQKKDEQDGPIRAGALNSQVIVGGEETQTGEARSSVEVAGNSQEEPSARHLPDASPSCPTVNQKEPESFRHSENQNSTANNSYSIYKMQTMKNLGSDPSHRESKRLKGHDDVHDPKQIAGEVPAPFASRMNSINSDLSSNTTVAARDSKILNFSPQLGNRNTFQLPHGAVTSQDMLSFVCNDPQKFATGNVTGRTEHTGISPQVAPSWFEQYGTLKNGQLLPVHNMSRMPMKNLEQWLISGKSPNNLVPHSSAQSPASMRPKKRKTATSDLLSWNKEIGQCLKRLQNLSSAELDWAQSSNRLIEKVDDETANNEDLLPMTRLRRRLILTTQLLQQVLRPPSAGVLSLDASSDNEVIVYSLARSALGDACSLICGVESNSPVESANLSSGKVKTSERIQDQYFSKVVEDFVSREKELENELLRLDKRASILDFRLDCEDLERFSVINRFARFHGRGQVDGAETSSSSDANATNLKPCPQRYVSAHPMPRNVPERAQCLSL